METALNRLREIVLAYILSNRSKLYVDDVVNDCVLLCLEKGQELTFENLRRCFSTIRGEIQNSFSVTQDLDFEQTESKHCKCCDQTLPIAHFGYTQRKPTRYCALPKRVYQAKCKECQTKAVAEYRSKNKEKIREKEYWKKYNERKRILSQTEEYKAHRAAYMREYYKKKKQAA